MKTRPSDLLQNRTELDQLRSVTPEDLLGRDEVSLDLSQITQFFKSKTVLVTGAGGSIGSELCRQISYYGAECLVLYEQNEFNLYQIEQELQDLFPGTQLVTVLGDVRDCDCLERVFAAWKPSVVYHAAAYKHVPMVEKNPFEGIRTNILGTRNVASLCVRYDVGNFVLVSTDKAVNPTNIMGATKRVAEMVVQRFSVLKSKTKFSIVRFGNVLGSSGSVIPLFKRQIEKGGPITLTHPEIERYFMSIPEATRLVIQASLIGEGGEVFVLDMGAPVKIIDLARKMISLAGLREGRDIKIEIVGLRPGEKLFEELLADKETTKPTSIKKIKIAAARSVTETQEKIIDALLDLATADSVDVYREELQRIVPEYVPAIRETESHV
ncbi:MAG: UDP-N-acetylglucosamine 4,6-dehydratase family protein [Bacteriovoracia bacterium]